MAKVEKVICLFLNATGIKNYSQKQAKILHLIGDEVQDVFKMLGEIGTTYDDAMAKLDSHLKFKKNIPNDTRLFYETEQEVGESIDAHVTRLKKLTIYCEYEAAIEDEIRDEVFDKCKSSKLRKRLLQELDLTLEKLLRIGKLMEQSDHQTRQIEEQNGAGTTAETKPDSFLDLNKIKTKSKQTSIGNPRYNQHRQCGKCGMKNHRSNNCRITKGKECMKCGIIGNMQNKIAKENRKPSSERK